MWMFFKLRCPLSIPFISSPPPPFIHWPHSLPNVPSFYRPFFTHCVFSPFGSLYDYVTFSLPLPVWRRLWRRIALWPSAISRALSSALASRFLCFLCSFLGTQQKNARGHWKPRRRNGAIVLRVSLPSPRLLFWMQMQKADYADINKRPLDFRVNNA